MPFEGSGEYPTTKSGYDDGSTTYANAKNLWIQFMSVHTGRAVQFKGFLTAFTDKFSSDWNEESVYGRMDPIVTFKGTKRNLNFGFDVPSVDTTEARTNFEKLSLLIALLYPGYSGGSSTAMSSAPLFKVKFINWIDTGMNGKVQETGLVGAIKGCDFTPDLEQGGHDLGYDLLPKMFKVSIDMTVLHTHALGWDAAGNWRGSGAGTKKNAFPYGLQFSEQLSSVPMPDAAVTQVADNGGGGTDEMQQAAAEEMLGGGMSMDPNQSGAPMTSADAPQTVNYLDEE